MKNLNYQKILGKMLRQMQGIGLAQMDTIQLLNRHDIKFVFEQGKLLPLLICLSRHYRILEVEGQRSFKYNTLYFDTPDFFLYRQHHNGKKNRYKVRVRRYLDSGEIFLEVKFKSNKGKTQKTRKLIAEVPYVLDAPAYQEVLKPMGRDLEIGVRNFIPTLWTNFRRITLANPEDGERVTIDLDLCFKSEITGGKVEKKCGLVIAELKREKAAQPSEFQVVAKKLGILPSGMSKYCLAVGLLNPDIKSNEFKTRIRSYLNSDVEKVS
ncbi:MAG: polyphosphate polymerase domain-containing protein [Bdellovibrionaceae bacterium]|nr:polyphosphate polymerase domain-containing protein [Pseudobdellovibrionaceae bacterium]